MLEIVANVYGPDALVEKLFPYPKMPVSESVETQVVFFS